MTDEEIKATAEAEASANKPYFDRQKERLT